VLSLRWQYLGWQKKQLAVLPDPCCHEVICYMKIQCQTWLAPEAAFLKIRRKKKGGEGRKSKECL
jgi:hypothetical protein